MLNNFEKQTSVPKVYAFLGLVGIYFFLIFFNIAGEFLVNFAGFLVPGYYSLDALFSASKVDDTQVSLCPDLVACYSKSLIVHYVVGKWLTFPKWLTVSGARLNYQVTLTPTSAENISIGLYMPS